MDTILTDRRRKLSDEQFEEMIRRLNSGESQKVIAKTIGVNRATVIYHSKRHCSGLKGRTGRLPKTAERYQAMAKKYDEGYSPTQVAEEFGVSGSTARKAIQQYGTREKQTPGTRGQAIQLLKVDPRLANRYFDHTVIRRYRVRNGLSIAQLAVKIGVAERTIITWEQGTCAPTAEGVLSLQILFGLAPQDFLIEKREDK